MENQTQNFLVVGPGGPTTSNDFNDVICPACAKALFEAQRLFPGLSSIEESVEVTCGPREVP
jgi:hypothetical protein